MTNPYDKSHVCSICERFILSENKIFNLFAYYNECFITFRKNEIFFATINVLIKSVIKTEAT